jgi:predicted P-loop ATPase
MSAKPVVTLDWLGELGQRAVTSGNEPVVGAGADWRDRLIKNRNGPATCLQNALVALQYAPEWQGVLHFNESALHVVAKATPPWDSRAAPFPWRDDDDVRTAAWMQRHGVMVSKEIAGQAVQTIAREFPFHPIREYLNGLVWDKIPRISTLREESLSTGGTWIWRKRWRFQLLKPCRFGSCGLRPCESRHKCTFKAQRVRRPSYCTAPAVLVMLMSE